MSKRLSGRGLVIAAEVQEAIAWCVREGCGVRDRWMGPGAHAQAVEYAKRHAETTGHRVRAEYTRAVEYDNVPGPIARPPQVHPARARQVAARTPSRPCPRRTP